MSLLDMFLPSASNAYRVNKGNWELFDADFSASPLTFTGTLPDVSFRCAVTVTSVTGHTDVSGSLIVGTESLAFTYSGQKKTTTVLLSALPDVTTSTLNCHILIEAIDSGGAPISYDTQTEIVCRFQDTQKSFRDSAGNWTTSQAVAYTDDSGSIIGTLFSFGGYDYQIAQVSAYAGLEGIEEYRKLYLTGKTLAPDDREVVVDEEDLPITRYMTRATYDTDEDGIVDKAEGIPVLDEVPSDLSGYSDGDMFKVNGKLYIVDKPA